MAAIILVGGCSSSGEVEEASSGVDPVAPDDVIAFCDRPPEYWASIGEPDPVASAITDEISDRLDRLTAQFGDEPAWNEVVYRPQFDVIVVRTNGPIDADLRARILVADGDVVIERARYTAQEQEIAFQHLHAVFGFTDGRAAEIVSLLSSGGGLYDARIEISLTDLSAADTLVSDFGIEPPLDRFCIEPIAIPRAEPLG